MARQVDRFDSFGLQNGSRASSVSLFRFSHSLRVASQLSGLKPSSYALLFCTPIHSSHSGRRPTIRLPIGPP
jgi:hypothetical protein